MTQAEDRDARLAAALRANLKRRKAAAASPGHGEAPQGPNSPGPAKDRGPSR